MYTVVIADDEKAIRRSLINLVDWDAVGFRVIGEAENGIDALELVEKLEPDLLLTDIKMPFISGLELARQVREVRPMTQIAFLSGYDEFRFAQEAIQYNIISYMLKPITSEKITEELINIRNKIERTRAAFIRRSSANQNMEKNHFLLNLLMDEYTPEVFGVRQQEYEASALEEAMECGLLQTDTPEMLSYVVMVTAIIDSRGKNCTNLTNIKAIDGILGKYMKCFSVIAQKKILSLIMGTKRELDKYVAIAAEEISQSVNRIMLCKTLIGISNKADKITDIHISYKEAMAALSYASSKDDGIHFIADEERIGIYNQESLQKEVAEIEDLFKNGEDSQIKEYLDHFYRRIKNQSIPQSSVSYIKMQIIAMVLRVVYTVGGDDVARMVQIQNVTKIFTATDSKEEETMYLELLLKGKKLIREQREKSSEDLCSRAIRMINERYNDPTLSLSNVSSEVGITPNYLSALIKKEYGLSFKDYLTKKRMEVAQDLLKYTGLKVWEVAEKSGYSEQHYFSYSFKKYTGESPNAYRRLYEEAK